MAMETDSRRLSVPSRRGVALLMILLGAISLMIPPLAGASSSVATSRNAATAQAQNVSNITITQTTASDQGWFCLPGALILQRSIHNTPEYFELVIKATARPCAPIKATAAIYGMPGSGVAWPQRLVETKNFTISKAGTTRVRFTKTCDPVQFDVLTGATPEVISPLGPWHGPLLFPFDMETSYQYWGCGSGTTTTTTSPCENYAARQMAVTPPNVERGQTVTVSGLGTPGTTLSVWITPIEGSEPGIGGPAVTVAVPASGQWSTQFTIPPEALPGTWSANAQASDCDGVTSVTFRVIDIRPSVVDDGNDGNGGDNGNGGNGTADGGDDNGANGTNGDGSSNGDDTPVSSDDATDSKVLSSTADQPLPQEAVLSASLSNANAQAGTAGATTQSAKDSSLAWTGSNVRGPIVVGVALLAAGVLLLLRSRRAAEAV